MRQALRLAVLLCMLLPALCGTARALDAGDLLEPDKAFRFSARALDAGTIEVSYRIAEGYYLYRERFRFDSEPAGRLGAAQFPQGLVHEDQFFGRQQIYRKELRFTVPVQGSGDLKLLVTSQGCADVGVCYIPHTQSAGIKLAGLAGAMGGEAAPLPSLSSSDEDIAALFAGQSFWLVLASFFGFGLLLAFTPCVLPMIPILSGIVIGEGAGLGKRRAFVLSLAYVLGMATAYAAAGVTAAYTGGLLAAALQSPWMLGGFALVFVVLSLSLFGLYELQLPDFLHHRLHAAQGRLTGGRLASVAAMGLASAVIVSPCVAAPLAGALLYIAQSRDTFAGGAALFVMALGMGVPLIVVGVSEGAWLPKSGAWMVRVKQLFGLLLLGVAAWIASPLISVAIQMLIWTALLVAAGVLLRALDALPAGAGLVQRLGKALGLMALLAGAAMLLGLLSGSRDPLRPLDGLFGSTPQTTSAVHFERVKTLAELEGRVKSAGRPVMLDFYADWCVSCKEMERYTFSDARVQERFSKMLLLQVDVTGNSEEDKALLKRFRLFGPPGIIFFKAGGEELRAVRVIGYQPPTTFLKSLEKLN